MAWGQKSVGWGEKGDPPGVNGQTISPAAIDMTGGGNITMGNNGRLILDDGSAAAPSLTFESFLTTGLHASAGPAMNFDASGAVNSVVTGTSLFNVAAGRVFQAAGGFRIAGSQAITAVGNSISLAIASGHQFPIDPDGNYTLTSTPTIADGANGQLAWIVNTDTAFTVTIQDESALAGSNVKGRGGANIVLGPRVAAALIFSTTTGLWHEL